LYLLAIILGISGQSIVKKPYTQKTNGAGVYFFNTLLSAAALLFFVVTSSKFSFDISFIPYSIGFAVSYAVASVFMVLAIAYGSLSLTSLFISYSLMIPTFYGLIIGDTVSTGFIPGMLLLVISLFLTNKSDEKAKISLKWIICVFLSFFGNGMCTVVQKMQQIASNGAYKNEFMIVALAIVTVVMLIMSILKERTEIKFFAKSGWHWAIICGALNGMVNLFVMILSGKMPVSLMFPLISAGGLVVTYIVSRFFYKEKLTKIQFIGFIFGLMAVVFLNV
jgi:drug/metabolite transporter (DMT)-like permease